MSARATTWRSTLLVFLPILLLAALGIKGLQSSKHATREAAERETAQAVRRLAESMELAMATIREVPIPIVYPLPPVPGPPSPARQFYEDAQREGSPDNSRESLDEALLADPDAVSESGIPLAALAAWERLRHGGEQDLVARVDSFARTIVESHPSILTPEWLQRAAALLDASQHDTQSLSAWQERWRSEEQARAALRQNAALLQAAEAPVWIQHDGQSWWAERDQRSRSWRLVPMAALAGIASEACRKTDLDLPPYAALQVSLSGVPLVPMRTGETLAQSEAGLLQVTGVLHRPDSLYAQQHQQTLWLAALLGCAVLAALGGTWMMHASLQHERQVSALKSDFVSSISHELRAPVASIRIMAENLESGIVSDPARGREYHRLIADECSRLGALIDNVLDLARIERNRKTYEFAEVDVPALITDTVRLLQPRAGQRRQEIRNESAPLDPSPICDGMAIQQALINLLDNAIKFAPEHTVIVIRAKVEGGAHWLLEVVDQGSGIPESEHSRIFERFYRIGSELRRETRGTGIGLTIVKHIAEGHGGTISVANHPSGGATFTLRLPLQPRSPLSTI